MSGERRFGAPVNRYAAGSKMVTLDGSPLTIAEVVSVARDGAPVSLGAVGAVGGRGVRIPIERAAS